MNFKCRTKSNTKKIFEKNPPFFLLPKVRINISNKHNIIDLFFNGLCCESYYIIVQMIKPNDLLNRFFLLAFRLYICFMPANKFFFITVIFIFCSLSLEARYKHKHKAHGIASYYSNKYDGKKTATGDVFSNRGFTAASNKFRLGAYARVTNRSNGKHVYVKINDRMGNGKRLIDLTLAATEQLDFKREGTARVKVKVVRERKGRRGIRRQG